MPVARYVARRLLSGILTLWVIASLTFFLSRAIPGGPFDSEKQLPPAVLENLNKKYHLDWPIWKQYLDYMWRLIKWDLGPSFRYANQTVNEIIAQGFPVSAQLGLMALAVAVVVGISAGIISALRQYRWQDHLAMTLATVGFSVPSFILGSILIYIFSYRLGWLPASRWGTWDRAIMPVLALSAFPTSFIARLVRSSMLEVLQQDYMKAARAKGMPGYILIYRHALKNAILPVITFLGPLSAQILTGSFVIETIFAIPGMGRTFVTSIANRDYTLIMGVTMFYSVLLVAANLIVDLLYAVVDPRIKVAGGGE